MKHLLLLIGFAITMAHLGAVEPAAQQKDSLAVTSHSAINARTSPGASMPDRIAMKLDVDYTLTSESEGIVSLALDDAGEMEFSTFDNVKVSKGRGSVYLKAAARMIQRPVLHCLIILKKKGASPADPPLAITTMTIDINRITRH